MRKLILILMLIPFIVDAQARPKYKIDDADAHYAAGAAISTVTTLTLHALDVKYAPAWGVVAAVVIGGVKEVIDHSKHGIRLKDETNEVFFDHFSDFGMTGSGGMTATITLFIVLKPKNKKKDDYYLTPKWTY